MDQPLIVSNANVITMDVKDTRCRALALEKGRIIRAGDESDMKGLMDQGWPVEDLGGRTVLPGFIDTHEHMMFTGSQETAVHLDTVENIDHILELLSAQAGETPGGHWIRGGYLNEQEIAEKAMPVREDLDRAVPDHPVILMHVTGHMCSLNTKALEILNPPLTLEGLDTLGGRPTGVVRDPGILTFIQPAMAGFVNPEDRLDYIRAAAGLAVKKGITTLHALDGGESDPTDTRAILENLDRLPIHVVCYHQSMDLNDVEQMGLPRVGGCICSDGAFEAHTAALFEPYIDEPDNYGALTYSQERMDEFIMEAHRRGLQIAVHCESERSIEQVLWAMEKALRAFPRQDHRHRIEHFELPTYNQIQRLARAGIMASMQPAFIPALIGQEDMALYEMLLGRARLNRVHPYRTIFEAGIPISGGSDSPVTPYNPLAGVQAAVTHPNRDERVDLRQALAMFTTTAAWSAFEEDDKGSLEPGKLADLVVLAEDPFRTDPGNIRDIGIEQVFVAGQKLLLT